MVSPSMDRDTEALLSEFASASGPAFDDLSVDDKRAALDVLLGEATPYVPNVDMQDISIPSRSGDVITGFACRTPGEEPLPILFLIQGGGWSFARSNGYRPLAALLAKELQRLVVCVDFRLAPEHKFPAGLDDCMDVYLWLRFHGTSLGGRPDSITLMGDSAGGNIAGALALQCVEEQHVIPEALVLVYPMTDVSEGAEKRYRSRWSFGDGSKFLTEASIEWAAGSYTSSKAQRDDPLVSLVHHDHISSLPPTTIIVAGMDPLRDEGEYFASLLKDAGVDVACRNYENTIHGFLSFFHKIRLAHKAIQYIGRRLL